MRSLNLRAGRPRHGFTLVELLTVIVILSILAALLTGGVIMARIAARRAAMRMEIGQLEAALENYKREYGEYPPDFAGLDGDSTAQETAKQRVISHLRKRFPRWPATDWDTLVTNLKTASSNALNLDNFTPANAIVFWLGGMPSATTPITMTGFSANPADPFNVADTSRVASLLDFRSEQLANDGGGLAYYPANRKKPYYYFKGDSTGAYYYAGNIKPYYNEMTNTWVNPKTYQIISAGLDDGFGTIDTSAVANDSDSADNALDLYAPWFPSGGNFAESTDGGNHFDNITNFTRSTLEAEMKK